MDEVKKLIAFLENESFSKVDDPDKRDELINIYLSKIPKRKQKRFHEILNTIALFVNVCDIGVSEWKKYE